MMVPGAGGVASLEPIPFDAAVFDLDGTLIDSAPDITRALNRTLAAFGRRVVDVDEVRAMVGDGACGLVRDAFARTGDPLTDATRAEEIKAHYLDAYFSESTDPSIVYPGVVDTLRRLAAEGVRLGLCTNKSERIARKVLDLVGLTKFFEIIAGGDSLPVRKPDPGHLAHVVAGLGGGRAVMVGDGANDVKAARGLGIPVVAVTFGYPRMPVEKLGADALIDHFRHLPETLRDLWHRLDDVGSSVDNSVRKVSG